MGSVKAARVQCYLEEGGWHLVAVTFEEVCEKATETSFDVYLIATCTCLLPEDRVIARSARLVSAHGETSVHGVTIDP